MEMTIEQKQKKYEKDKEWRRNNPEKVKQYAKRSYEKHKEYYRNYYKNYYQENKKHMAETQKKWREFNDKRDTVYMFINDLGENIYIGSTTYKNTRFANHLTGNSNLKLNAEELVSDYNLVGIIYKDFTDYNLSRDDLYYIESYYKESQGEILGVKPVTVNEDNLTMSKQELIDLAENIVKYQEFDKLERYLN